jgi:TatD DNase family protein
MSYFIDFHTHTLRKDKNVIAIVNLFPSYDVPVKPYFSAGIHPWQANEYFELDRQNELWKYAGLSGCLAVGECGLDVRKEFEEILPRQIEIFEYQIAMANDLDKPVIVHCVKCYDIISKYLKKLHVPVIIHGFSKSIEVAEQILKFDNVYLSFGHLILNEKTKAYRTYKELPPDRTLLETDDKPVKIERIYHQAARIRKMDLYELQKIMSLNFGKIFKKSVI